MSIKIFIAKIFIFRLTGRPKNVDWPECSVDLDQFLVTVPNEPRQLVPRLCDYSNDLLKVRLVEREYFKTR